MAAPSIFRPVFQKCPSFYIWLKNSKNSLCEFIFIITYSYEGHTMCYVVPESLCFRNIPTSSWTKVLNQSSYLESLDNLIVESKLNKLNRKVERMSKIIYFIILKLTPATALLPTFFLTVFNHFIYDSNDQSYFLPFPLMYVETLYQRVIEIEYWANDEI